MFNQLFKNPECIKKYNTAPFLAERMAYLKYCENRGIALKRLRQIAQYLLTVIKFLKLEEKQTPIIRSLIIDAATEWGKYQKNNPYNHYNKQKEYSSESSYKLFIHHATSWFEILE